MRGLSEIDPINESLKIFSSSNISEDDKTVNEKVLNASLNIKSYFILTFFYDLQ